MDGNIERKFNVQTMDGRNQEFKTPYNISILDLRKLIEQKTGVPVHRQRLLCKGRLLKDDMTLNQVIQKDNECIQMMAMAEEVARARVEAQQRINQNQSNQEQPQNRNNHLGIVENIFDNIISNLRDSGAQGSQHTRFSIQGFGVPQIFGGIMSSQNRSNSTQRNSRTSTNQTNAQSQRSNSQLPSNTRVSPTPAQSSQTQNPRNEGRAEVLSGSTEEAKESRQRNRARPTAIALPHEHIRNIHTICDSLMGDGSTFPSSPAPALDAPRNPATILGNYLMSLQLAIQRLNAFICRSGEILQRESQIVAPGERTDGQRLINQTGQAMEDLSRALLLSSHYFKDFYLNPRPGRYRVNATPHQDFAEMNSSFIDSLAGRGRTNTTTVGATQERDRTQNTSSGNQNNSQTSKPASEAQTNPNSSRRNQPNRTSGIAQSSGTSNSSRVFPLSAASSARLSQPGANRRTNAQNSGLPFSFGVSQPGQSTQDLFSGSLQGVTLSGSGNNLRSMVEDLASRYQQNQSQRSQPPTTSRRNTTSRAISHTRDANMEDEEQKQQTSVDVAGPFADLLKNSSIDLRRTIRDYRQNLPGNFSLDTTLRECAFKSDSANIPNNIAINVVLDQTVNEMLPILSGEYQIVDKLHPKMKEVLLRDYLNNSDNPEARKLAADQINTEIMDFIDIPDSVRDNITGREDPRNIIRENNPKHILKLIKLVLDLDCTPKNSDFRDRFIKTIKWWAGDIINKLIPRFRHGESDVIKFINSNVNDKISKLKILVINFVSGMLTGEILKMFASAYVYYKSIKSREDNAEARELGITLQELYERRMNNVSESPMEVDKQKQNKEEDKEEAIGQNKQERRDMNQNENGNLKSQAVMNPTPAESLNTSKEKPELSQVIEEKDPDIKALVERMEEDQSMLVVNPPETKPLSVAYQATDSFHPQNIDTSSPITECESHKQDAKESTKQSEKKSNKESKHLECDP
ncbi:unnamed protein product [Moneuplotes crassus]|uniref:Ubiquitin-like domain-containing protein n=1 Tax=Euplotes crassus TaxID=5936 RepID=A0AAD1XZD7_EUPCR|nr:unnamed protein product [Moneuplotes crassus]